MRLQRVARKHIPIFRVVLTDSRNSTKSGKAHEVLGIFNLVTDEKRVNAERVKYWLSKGAQPSGTVHNFLVGERIIAGKKINVLPKRRPIKKETPAASSSVEIANDKEEVAQLGNDKAAPADVGQQKEETTVSTAEPPKTKEANTEAKTEAFVQAT